jgi:hypothetical protein
MLVSKHSPSWPELALSVINIETVENFVWRIAEKYL